MENNLMGESISALSEFFKGMNDWGILAVCLFFMLLFYFKDKDDDKSKDKMNEAFRDLFNKSIESSNALSKSIERSTEASNKIIESTKEERLALFNLLDKISLDQEEIKKDVKSIHFKVIKENK